MPRNMPKPICGYGPKSKIRFHQACPAEASKLPPAQLRHLMDPSASPQAEGRIDGSDIINDYSSSERHPCLGPERGGTAQGNGSQKHREHDVPRQAVQ